MKSNRKWFYVYKITFEEVPHFYIGVRASKVEPALDPYLGSPVANKGYWRMYTPKKSIFHGGIYRSYAEAKKTENFLILSNWSSFYCLNRACGAWISLDSCYKGGQTTAKRLKEDPIFANYHRLASRNGGLKSAKLRAELSADEEYKRKIATHLTALSHQINERRLTDQEFDEKFRNSRSKAAKGTMWVNNGVINRRVSRSTSLETGWYQGRVRTTTKTGTKAPISPYSYGKI